MGNSYGRTDLVVAIVLALIIAVWLIAYAALMILHDRSAGSAGRGDWRRETTVQISDLLRPTTNGIFAMIERLEDAG
jgi:hypothetical protein